MEPKFARFTPTSAPQGGFCISVFIACKKASKILVCKMTRPEDWYEQDGLPPEKAAEMIQSGSWVLPAAHLLYGEDPETAARRVVKSHLGVSRYRLRNLGLYSFTTRHDDGAVHWDLCSLYEVIIKQTMRPAQWYSKVEYLDVKRLKAEHFTRGHGDVLAAAGMITD
jgi:ADP-ribose pyrophosphatase YjhB (NUDIX family)